uniref:Uncharacterized protein n=1 Tax=Anopheles albimanus TaxID=7167 RepID=A0A182FY10_ANOAL
MSRSSFKHLMPKSKLSKWTPQSNNRTHYVRLFSVSTFSDFITTFKSVRLHSLL